MEPAVRPTRARRAARRPRGGFTLIELLITLGIILVLITAGVLGFRALEASSSRRQTQTALAAAEGLLKGMNSIGAASRIEGPPKMSPRPFYILDRSGTTDIVTSVEAPASVRTGTTTRRDLVEADGPGLKTSPSDPNGDKNCTALMRMLLAAPENKKAVQALPRDLLLEPRSPKPGDPQKPFDPPLLGDAWGNPLILVPSGGMTKVKISSESDPNKTFVIASPSGRPFWASAGPDGDFQKGDDNLYSFDK